jgi:hypothetical protein
METPSFLYCLYVETVGKVSLLGVLQRDGTGKYFHLSLERGQETQAGENS